MRWFDRELQNKTPHIKNTKPDPVPLDPNIINPHLASRAPDIIRVREQK
jgi:hypothetical protein